MRFRFLIYAVVILLAVGGGVWMLSEESLFESPLAPHRRASRGNPPPKTPFESTPELVAEVNEGFTVEAKATNNTPLAGKPVGAAWPQFNGIRRDNKSDETGLLQDWPAGGPPLLWTAEGIGEGYSTVAVVDGVAYTMGNKGKAEAVIALDVGTGEKIWSTPIAWASQASNGPGPRSTPTVSGDALFALGGNGDLACLDRKSGEVRWQKNILKEFNGGVPGWGICESVLVDDGRLICTPGGHDATVVALDPATGDCLWKCLAPDKDRAGYASNTIADVGGIKQYVHFTGAGTIGIRADNGEFLWRENSASNDTANCSSPQVVGDLVFSASGYGTGAACVKLTPNDDNISAELLYTSRDMTSHHGDMVVIDGLVYVSNDAGILMCLDLATGTRKWRGRSAGKGSMTFADNRIYLRSEGGKVALIEPNAEGYKEHGQFKEPNHTAANYTWPHPVVAHQRLFLRDQDLLMCYDIRAK